MEAESKGQPFAGFIVICLSIGCWVSCNFLMEIIVEEETLAQW